MKIISTEGNALRIDGKVIKAGTGSYSVWELCKKETCKCRPKEFMVNYQTVQCSNPDSFEQRSS